MQEGEAHITPQGARHHGRPAWPWLAVLMAIALAGVAVERQARAMFLAEAARAGTATLRLAVATLEGQLDRFARLPPLVAENGPIRRLAETPDEPAPTSPPRTSTFATWPVSSLPPTSVSWTRGLTRAALNFDTETSSVGGNFAFRPYFT